MFLKAESDHGSEDNREFLQRHGNVDFIELKSVWIYWSKKELVKEYFENARTATKVNHHAWRMMLHVTENHQRGEKILLNCLSRFSQHVLLGIKTIKLLNLDNFNFASFPFEAQTGRSDEICFFIIEQNWNSAVSKKRGVGRMSWDEMTTWPLANGVHLRSWWRCSWERLKRSSSRPRRCRRGIGPAVGRQNRPCMLLASRTAARKHPWGRAPQQRGCELRRGLKDPERSQPPSIRFRRHNIQ